ncbi:Rv0623 family protein transcription factor [Salinisphaera sp. PC39]|uniref:type II toxin-antitoxin system VapB family antitoxin n=1 Tax=Salinisphaera sp. PC39 TaxID=1304156 RepID=UPI0033414CB4
MALSIKDAEADRLARELAARTGQSLTNAVTAALREQLRTLRDREDCDLIADDLQEIARRCAQRPVRDRRTPEELVGYDEHGLPR